MSKRGGIFQFVLVNHEISSLFACDSHESLMFLAVRKVALP